MLRAVTLFAVGASAIQTPALNDPCRAKCTAKVQGNAAAVAALSDGSMSLVCDTKGCDSSSKLASNCGFKGLDTICRGCYNRYVSGMDGEWCNSLWQATLAYDADDMDLDGLSNDEEKAAGTNPNQPDSDGDTLTDSEEVEMSFGGRKTLPLSGDTDGDGLKDGLEVHGIYLGNAGVCDGRSSTHYVKRDGGCWYVSDPTLRSTDGGISTDMDKLIAVQRELGLIAQGSSSPVLDLPPANSGNNGSNNNGNPGGNPGGNNNGNTGGNDGDTDVNNTGGNNTGDGKTGGNTRGGNKTPAPSTSKSSKAGNADGSTDTETSGSAKSSSSSSGGLSSGAVAGIAVGCVAAVAGGAALMAHKKRKAGTKAAPATASAAPVI